MLWPFYWQENGEEDKEGLADDPPSQLPTQLISEPTVVNETQGNEEDNKAQFSSQVLFFLFFLGSSIHQWYN